MPEGDADYSTRWRLIKSRVARNLPDSAVLPKARRHRGERAVWQRRFWEHRIRDDADLERHAAYIHWNPVKHGLVGNPEDWPYSSLHAWIRRGWYAGDDVRRLAAEISVDRE
jgi:putative transposase